MELSALSEQDEDDDDDAEVDDSVSSHDSLQDCSCTIGTIYNDKKKDLFFVQITYLPPANEVWGKVMFLYVSVILSRGKGLASQHASQLT